MPNILDIFSKKLFFILFFFFLFGFFKLNTADIQARCSSINGGCYVFNDCGTVTNTCGGTGASCTYYNGPGYGANCTLPTMDDSGLTATACGYIQSVYGGTCSKEYACYSAYGGTKGATNYTSSNCDNACSAALFLSCQPTDTYAFHVDTKPFWVQDMCIPNCPTGYHKVTTGGTCSVTCGACCNSVSCAPDSVVTTYNTCLKNQGTYDCGYDNFSGSDSSANLAACEAKYGAGNCYPRTDVGLATCQNNCKQANQNYYYCNSGSCTGAGLYTDSNACAADHGGATCYDTMTCDNKCSDTVTMYYCDMSDTCTASFEKYENSAAGITACSIDKGASCFVDSNCNNTCTSTPPPPNECVCPNGVSTCPTGAIANRVSTDNCGNPCYSCVVPQAGCGFMFTEPCNPCAGYSGVTLYNCALAVGMGLVGCNSYWIDIPIIPGSPATCDPKYNTKTTSEILTASSPNLCLVGGTTPAAPTTFQVFTGSNPGYFWTCSGSAPMSIVALVGQILPCSLMEGDSWGNQSGSYCCGPSTCSADGCFCLPSCVVSKSLVGCFARSNNPPVLDSFVIRNNEDTIVTADVGTSRNHLCDPKFNNSRLVKFEVAAHDLDVGDTMSINLSWNGHSIPRLTMRKAGTSTVATFEETFDSSLNSNFTYPLTVSLTDNKTPVTAQPRSLKIWDCGININGSFYDGTNSVSCPNIGFTTIADPAVLVLKNFNYINNSINTPMNIGSPANTYSGRLNWGLSYGISFNSDFSMSNPRIRFKDSAASTWICGNVDTGEVDPYSSNPTLNADLTGVLIQSPWWQTQNGGAISNSSISARVPATCVDNCKISQNALVSAGSIESTSGKSLSNSQDWYINKSSAKLVNINNYDYFYEQYFVKKNVGTVISGDKTVNSIADFGSDANNVYFINGNLNISGDVKLGTRKFLMIIVSGDINVSNSVRQIDGIYVAKNIDVGGRSTNQLVFNGSLFTLERTSFTRDYEDSVRIRNNTLPIVVVKYNPELIFNIPGKIAKVLINWQWGN